ncbi:hypothetical protein KCQ_05676, partial [Pectobacterium atrosepticum ICMP 1526]
TLSSAKDHADASASSAAAVALNSANSYTDWAFSRVSSGSSTKIIEMDNRINNVDNRVNSLESRIDKNQKKLNAGIAGVTAIASIPYVAENNFSYGVGLGNYQNGNAMAAGVQYKTSLNTNVRMNVSWDSSRNTAMGVGFSGGW